jgi:hypothetical protein
LFETHREKTVGFFVVIRYNACFMMDKGLFRPGESAYGGKEEK